MFGAINRYVFRQLAVGTGLVALVLAIVIWLVASLRIMHYIVNSGLPLDTFVIMTLLLLPQFLPVILALATFVAVLWTYHRLVTDSELIVMRATGLSDLGLARPAILLAIVVSIISGWITLGLGPNSARVFKEMQFVHRHDFSAMLIQPGTFNTIRDKLTIYVREHLEHDELIGIMIHDDREPGKRTTLMAEQGRLITTPDGPRVALQNGNRQEVDLATGKVSLLYFDQYTLDLAGFAEEIGQRWREPTERMTGELFKATVDDVGAKNVREFRAEAHFRLASLIYPLAVTLVGLAVLLFGEFDRRGYMTKMILSALLAPAVLLANFLVKGLTAKDPSFTPLLYATTIVPAIVGFVVIAVPSRMRRGKGIPMDAAGTPIDQTA